MPSSMEVYPTTENAKLEYQIQMNRDLVEPKRNVDRIYTLGKLYFSKIILVMDVLSTPHIRKSKFNIQSDRVNLVAPGSPIECLLYLPIVRAIYCTNCDRKG